MLPLSYANVVQGRGTNPNPNPSGAGTSSDTHRTDQCFDSTGSLFENNSHPLFLHNNDHPGLVLIAKKLIGPENYAPWSRSMQIALNARNKFVVVTGAFPQPETDSPLFAQWERVNDMIITWILNSVAEDISDGLNFVTSAKEVWYELQERFSGVNGHRIYQVMRSIHTLEQGNTSVEVYFHKLKGYWDEYAVLEPSVNCVCGAHKTTVEREQKRKLLQFLMGLHDSNTTIRGQILMMNPLPTLSQAYSYVKQDEKARHGFPAAILNSQVHLASSTNEPNQSADPVKKLNSSSKQVAGTTSSIKPIIKCTYCNFTGHTRENCYKLIGYPPNWKKREKTSAGSAHFKNFPATSKANHVNADTSDGSITQMQQQLTQLTQMMNMFVGTDKGMTSPEDHLAGMARSSLSISSLNFVKADTARYTWLVDTGATDHMCCSRDFFLDIQPLSSHITVALPDGTLFPVTHTGTVVIHEHLKLLNVLLVPRFSYNLLSVSKWIKDNQGSVQFCGDQCTFMKPSVGLTATGSLTNGLYHLDISS
nr:PREDICTED: uncharacterized protein LOC108221670 [Daucus carota subsp. sativus]